MNKKLNIRNSTAEFLIFTSLHGEDSRKVISELQKYRAVQNKIYVSKFDKLTGEL